MGIIFTRGSKRKIDWDERKEKINIRGGFGWDRVEGLREREERS